MIFRLRQAAGPTLDHTNVRPYPYQFPTHIVAVLQKHLARIQPGFLALAAKGETACVKELEVLVVGSMDDSKSGWAGQYLQLVEVVP